MRIRLTKFSEEQGQDPHDISLLNTLQTSIISTTMIDNHAIADIPTIHMPALSKQAADQQSFTQFDTLIDTALYCAPVGAFLAWSLSLQDINMRQMNDLGLVSVFPPLLIGTIVFITACFCMLLYRKRIRISALCLYFAVLILMLYGVNTLVEEMPRFASVYKHAGYTEYIMRTGKVDPTLTAYFSWPGFFSLSAFITKTAGYPDILNFATWAPIFYNIFYFGPLYMLFTSFTKDKRTVYLAIWLFYLTNWVGQDYYSPQGLCFFLYLTMIAILLKWFKTSPHVVAKPSIHRSPKFPFLTNLYRWLTAPDPLTEPLLPRQRYALIICVIVIFAFVVFSHQLTPFFTILSVFALVLLRRCSLWWLPLLMTVMTVLWIVFMSQSFLAGHASDVFSGFQLSTSLSANVTNRVAGDPQHLFITRMRLVMSLFVWGCAALGGFLRWRRGYQDATIILLALTPFFLFMIQPYGGEMLLRAYLFSQPSMVFLMATLLLDLPLLKKDSWRVAANICLCLLLLAGFCLTRYGNENMDYMTNDEVAGVRHLYSIAPAHSLLLGAWDGAPWQQQDIEKYVTATLPQPGLLPQDGAVDFSHAIATGDTNSIIKYIQFRCPKEGNVYMLFTRSQKVMFTSMAGFPPSDFDRLENNVATSGHFILVYSNPDARIYQFLPPEGGAR